ncbi:hypothetical protein PRIPAC_76701, partial [Pristionchus pacificus]|uniref:Uncharacterized protein n=1 Tax=Pristionchus pacificus TaxID=54126 RepID=A0A2A6C0C7_PRIPA
HSFRNIPHSVRLVPYSPFPSSPPRERGNRKRLDMGRHKIRPEKISMYDFALGTFKRVLEEVQQGVGIVLPESFKEYDPLARKLVDDLIEQYFSNGKKHRPDEAEKRMRERKDILPAQRMTFDQIRNRITTLLSQKKEHQRKVHGNRQRRYVKLIDDFERDLAEEGISLDDIEEELINRKKRFPAFKNLLKATFPFFKYPDSSILKQVMIKKVSGRAEGMVPGRDILIHLQTADYHACST